MFRVLCMLWNNCTPEFLSNDRSEKQVLQTQAPGPTLTLRRQVTVNTSLKSDKIGAFRASNTYLVELDNPSLTLDDPPPIGSAMRYTRSKYHAGSNSMRMRNTHYVLIRYIFTYYSCISKSCPIILKIIPEYLAQA